MKDNGCTKNPPRRIYINALILHVIVTVYIVYTLFVDDGRVLVQPLSHTIDLIGASAIKTVTFVGIVIGASVTWVALKNLVYLPMLCLTDQTLDAIWSLVKRRRMDK